MIKIGRNDPCPCGSGKKYKKCCMIKDESQIEAAPSGAGSGISASSLNTTSSLRRPGPRAAEIENTFQRACNYLDMNEFDRAARTFRSVLRLDPTHYKALTGFGRCLAEMGMREDARKCFEKALEINPGYAQASINLKLQG